MCFSKTFAAFFGNGLNKLSASWFAYNSTGNMVQSNAVLVEKLKKQIDNAGVLVFSKTYCPFCAKIKERFKKLEISSGFLELDIKKNGPHVQKALEIITGKKTVPQVFIRGKPIGGSDDVEKMSDEALLAKIKENKYDYDLVVIGGGSGGLALAKDSAKYGAKVALLDFVNPTPKGVTWGLGGTCVNVGCIPKKLMHQAALLNHHMEDAKSFGWDVKKNGHDWNVMVDNIQDHVHSLNFGYRSALMNNQVQYMNALGQIVDEHTIKTTDKRGVIKNITCNTIVIATGERPRYPAIPGAKECGITSDDLFSLDHNPGKTLMVGASYVSLECAGFLKSIGCDTTVMVRSIFLRGFDQQMAEMVAGYMEKNYDINFVRPCVPIAIRPVKGNEDATLKWYEVEGKYEDGTVFKDKFNTVVFAIGRDPCTTNLNIQAIRLEQDKSFRIVVDEEERTNVSNVYAIGDVNNRGYQLTPVAIEAGKNLARRLFCADDVLTDYTNVPTTVFTPLEYGAIGLSEEDAILKYGEEGVEVFHSNFQPLEWTIPHRTENTCYAKLIINKKDNDRVIGLHVLGPNAGEITQGYAIGMKLGATKNDFDRTIGIHPTCSEVFTTMHVSKRSGKSPSVTGC